MDKFIDCICLRMIVTSNKQGHNIALQFLPDAITLES